MYKIHEYWLLSPISSGCGLYFNCAASKQAVRFTCRRGLALEGIGRPRDLWKRGYEGILIEAARWETGWAASFCFFLAQI